MKVIALLLSFFVIGSIWTPCDDEIGSKEQIEMTDEHQENEHEEVNCSPFCTCHCCQTISHQPILVELYSISDSQMLYETMTTLLNNDLIFKKDRPPRH